MNFKKECGPCEGSGYYGYFPKDTCKVCNGAGILHLEGKRSEYKECGPCEGSGYYGYFPKDTCKPCLGYGLIRVSGPVAPSRKSTSVALGKSGGSGPRARSKVFVVHGRNHNVRNEIIIYLKELGLDTCIMEAGPHRGRTLPEKFEEMASDCSFAVFILTADDVLKDAKSGAPTKRARQNVVLDMGYFWGALGRRGKMAYLVENDPAMDLPSDIQGIGWIPITTDLAQTKLKLHSELRAAGLV